MRMPINPISRAPRRRGFTLIEILVIAALISLFSALAVVSIQYLVDSSKRKASILDLRTLANVLSFVKMDFGVFPKLGYLSFSHDALMEAGGSNPITHTYRLPPDFDTFGFYDYVNPDPAKDERGRRVGLLAKNVFEEWKGPYVPSSRSRGLIGARGYTVRMRMPNADAGTTALLDWPADPWGNPYVVYLVKLVFDEPTSRYVPAWVSGSTEEASYKALVVSYGPNNVPGGSSDRRYVTAAQRALAEDFKLYKAEGNDFVALTPPEYELSNSGAAQNRLTALENRFGYGTIMGAAEFPGIMDPNSDDLFMDIPSK